MCRRRSPCSTTLPTKRTRRCARPCATACSRRSIRSGGPTVNDDDAVADKIGQETFGEASQEEKAATSYVVGGTVPAPDAPEAPAPGDLVIRDPGDHEGVMAVLDRHDEAQIAE